jgi:hypothetical protein
VDASDCLLFLSRFPKEGTDAGTAVRFAGLRVAVAE